MIQTLIYPGSFDPLTLGHLNMIERGLRIAHTLIVTVCYNPDKQGLFSPEERCQMLRDEIQDTRVIVEASSDLLVTYAQKKSAQAILRGLRGVTDFEYESQMTAMNTHLAPHIETIFLLTHAQYAHISSRWVRDIARFGGDLAQLVPKKVEQRLKEKYNVPF